MVLIYIYHQKSSNNLYQRKSYSGQKNQHLCKPFTVCTTDGYIIDFFGPYLANVNDASIIKHIISTEDQFAALLEKDDLFVVDRGFRDASIFLKEKGFQVEMPSFMKKNQVQLSTSQANKSRIVTKVRWVVEAIHGIIKQKWKILNCEVKNQTLPKIKTYFRIVGCLHNLYGKKLISDKESTVKAALLEDISNMTEENSLFDYLEKNSLFLKRTKYTPLQDCEIQNFPYLTTADLKLITLGTYQISQAISYLAEHRKDDNFPLMSLNCEVKNIIHVKIQSRHISSKSYKVYVKYNPSEEGRNSIQSWMCHCKFGLRTLGCCVHIAAVISYLGNLRYDSKEFHPAKKPNDLFSAGQVCINEDSDEED